MSFDRRRGRWSTGGASPRSSAGSRARHRSGRPSHTQRTRRPADARRSADQSSSSRTLRHRSARAAAAGAWVPVGAAGAAGAGASPAPPAAVAAAVGDGWARASYGTPRVGPSTRAPRARRPLGTHSSSCSPPLSGVKRRAAGRPRMELIDRAVNLSTDCGGRPVARGSLAARIDGDGSHARRDGAAEDRHFWFRALRRQCARSAPACARRSARRD